MCVCDERLNHVLLIRIIIIIRLRLNTLRGRERGREKGYAERVEKCREERRRRRRRRTGKILLTPT